VDLWHIWDLLDRLLREVGQNMGRYRFDYDKAAGAYLGAMGPIPKSEPLLIVKAEPPEVFP
jgi:hypothetical protein